MGRHPENSASWVYQVQHHKLSELNEPRVQDLRKESHMLSPFPPEPKAHLGG